MPAPKKTMSSLINKDRNGGRGLLGESPVVNNNTILDPNEKTLNDTDRYRIKYIPVDALDDNTENTFSFRDTEMLELSIQRIGVLQNLVVIPKLDEDNNLISRYEIKAGSRRFAAVSNILKRAREDGNEKIIKRFSEVPCILLPIGATKNEIAEVIAETNLLARQLKPEDIFRNFEIVFELNEDGSYKYLPKNKNKYIEGSRRLKEMGYEFSASSIKDYLTIYTAHNQQIRKDLENGFLTKKQALIVSRMPSSMQDSVMEKFVNMTQEDIGKWLKTYSLEKKENDNENIKAVDAINNVTKASRNIKSLSEKMQIHFNDEKQKEILIENINELKDYITKLESLINKD